MSTPHVVEMALGLPPGVELGGAGHHASLLAQRVSRRCWPLVGAEIIASQPPFVPTLTLHGRAPVQGEARRGGRSAGTISWEEHFEAWLAYRKKYGNDQDAARLAERAGFGYEELVDLLGHSPTTWRTR